MYSPDYGISRNTPLRVFFFLFPFFFLQFPVFLLSLLAAYYRAARRPRRRRHPRRLEALGRRPAEAGRAPQAVPEEGRAGLAALGDDLVQLVLQAKAAGGEQQRQRYRRVHDH